MVRGAREKSGLAVVGMRRARRRRAMAPPDVVCLSHLPWAFGLERPHQVMRRLARDRHVFFVEEPVVTSGDPRTVMRTVEKNVHVVSVHVRADMDRCDIETAHRQSVGALAADIEDPLLWVYSPSSLGAAQDLAPSLLVYDCVADHAARHGVSAEGRARETELLMRADLVFTAGTALFEAKRGRNVSTYPLPSSVDADHFAAADGWRDARRAELYLGPIPGPRVGFLGPIDDRVDLGLVDALAAARPDIHIVLLGGLVDVTTWDLPDRPNVHWLGPKEYAELPSQVASWDVAIIPFRGDLATRRSEPSGLLPCIAAGKPIVTTPLDEMMPYAERGLVRVLEPGRFIAGVELALREANDPVIYELRGLAREGVLARTSWDRTCKAMMRLVDEAAMARMVASKRKDSERFLCSA